MTEQKISYLEGFSADDYYELPDYGFGSIGGFVCSALFKDLSPFFSEPITASPTGRYICGNSVRPGPGLMQGWDLAVLASPGAAYFVMSYGDAANAVHSLGFVCALTGKGQMLSGRALLVHFAFGIDQGGPAIQGGVNGTPLFGPVAIASYAPAPAGNPFRVGFGQLEVAGAVVDAPFDTGSIAGVTFRNSVPNVVDGTATLIDQFNNTIETLDIVDDPELGDVFSVRRGAADAPEAWSTSAGSVTLARVGTALAGVASRDRFFSGDATAQ